jgi:hypothetical protein
MGEPLREVLRDLQRVVKLRAGALARAWAGSREDDLRSQLGLEHDQLTKKLEKLLLTEEL